MRPASIVIVPVTIGVRIGPSSVASTVASPVLRMFGTNPCRMPRLAAPLARIAIRSLCRSMTPETSSCVSSPISRMSVTRTECRSSAMRIGTAFRSR